MTIRELVKDAYQTSMDKGWHDTDRSSGEMIALMHSELSEALEELRNGRPPSEVYRTSDSPKPEGVPIELADCIIRIADFCGKHDIDLEDAIRSKMEYNKTRPHRHGGKTF